MTATAVKERPILFSTDMVRAIQDGRKTQTRRVVELTEFGISSTFGYDWHFRCKRRLWQDYGHADLLAKVCKYKVGERLWVRETWAPCSTFDPTEEHGAIWRAGPWRNGVEPDVKWRPSIHMPRWASRITLEITDVRVERLNDISEKDAIAEGLEKSAFGNWKDYTIKNPCEHWLCPVNSFMSLWQSIYGEESWQSNPWVWAISFKRV